MITEQYHNSSLIVHSSFNDEENTLVVEFKSGDVYEYSDFTSSDYDSFIGAASQGKWFLTNIKNSFSYRKL